MKKIVFLLFAASVSLLNAQETDGQSEVTTTYDECTSFRKTPPLRELIKSLPPVEETEEIVIKPSRRYTGNIDLSQWNPDGDGLGDGAIQTAPPRHTKAGGMKANWLAQNSSSYPPDPSGAAGPDYYVQAINSKYRVYEKDGTAASSSFALDQLWPGENGGGDPIVMYDRFADRWFISQFSDYTTADKIMIAISETADPLGAYYTYVFDMPDFPDYPKFGVWSNAYYMSCNMSSNDCIAFEREAMLLGDSTAGKINMTFPSFYQFFNSIAPAYAEGPIPPDADEPFYFFAVQEDGWSGVTGDHIKILKAEVDWVTPSNSSVTNYDTLHTAPFDADFASGWGWEDIPQEGTTQKLDPVSGIFMYRAQYRRFDGYNVMMLCQTVDVGSNRAGIRWYELRENNDGVWYIHQQSTYAPADGNSRWLPSISMDAQGSIALAYSFSGPNEYPGIRYTGRFYDDPLNEMTVPEQIAVEGASAQTVTNRYGDYAQMSMDPNDDMTFWFTGEYTATGGGPKTRIFSFSTWHLAGMGENKDPLPFFNAYQPSPEVVRVIWKDLEDQQVTASIIDMSGKMIHSGPINTNDTQADFDVQNFSPGIYIVSLTGKNTNLSQKIYLAQ